MYICMKSCFLPQVMQSQGLLTPAIASVRNAVGAKLSRHYCSVLVNHYMDAGSGMRFHADPGQVCSRCISMLNIYIYIHKYL